MSADPRYRFHLFRSLNGAVPGRVLFIMLNPSTADDITDDPTIRRCMGFAKAWGYGCMSVVNLCALRATDPKALASHTDPVGHENDKAILHEAGRADLIVCAWGASGGNIAWRRHCNVSALLRARGFTLHHLGLTKTGRPRHPLYLSADTTPIAWGAPEAQRPEEP